MSRPVSDLLWIELTHPVRFIIVRLGDIDFPACRYSYTGRRGEAQGAHCAPVDGGGDAAVQLVCQLRGVEFVGTTVSCRPKPDIRKSC